MWDKVLFIIISAIPAVPPLVAFVRIMVKPFKYRMELRRYEDSLSAIHRGFALDPHAILAQDDELLLTKSPSLLHGCKQSSATDGYFSHYSLVTSSDK